MRFSIIGSMKWGIEAAKAYLSTTVPILNIITRKVYGIAGAVMVDSRDPCMRVSWPSGEWGSLPLEGGIEASHSHELRQAAAEGKREERYKELEGEYLRLMNPIRTANAFGVEEIIDPAQTRNIAASWAAQV